MKTKISMLVKNVTYKHHFIQRPIHSSFGWVKPIVESYVWTGKIIS